ncbi:MAG: AAA family ATPase [Herminiimonas sp.]|nr:AAA family ATPase [Herminiimonas sp.]
MKLIRLHLQAFGPFTDRILDFGATGQSLVIVYGPNEAGKSSMLRAISDLRFGIPAQSKDNFVHAHPDMRVGGTFVDRQGAEFSVVRRKGRGATLNMAGAAADVPVPPEIEAMITCGLTKEDHDAMFGLDHGRLREGGEALLKGEGEVGAALFEASAGVRSIPAVLEQLDLSARKHFMPGARGKNALINAALRDYHDRQADYKRALIRPAQWSDLFKKHQAAAEALGILEQRRRDLNARLLDFKEMRAVAPVLRTLDQAVLTSQELAHVILLSPESATERAGAEAGLAAATHSAGSDAASVARHGAVLAGLASDTAVIAIGSTIDRLALSAESFDAHQKDLAQASSDVLAETARTATLAARIDPSALADEVCGRAPSPAFRAGIDQKLQAAERAGQMLAQHRELLARQSTEPLEALPEVTASPESRIALRSARLEVTRCDAALTRLAALPAEIKATRRALDGALTETGLADEAAISRIRLMLDGEIDTATSQCDQNATRRAGLTRRIAEISSALTKENAERGRLLAAGAVPTRDEVLAARKHRDEGWRLVQGTYIARTNPDATAYCYDAALPEAFTHAITRADQLIDDLARDTQRATQLQACLLKIATLEGDRRDLHRQVEQLDQEAAVQDAAWATRLATAGLPALAPGALREWQARLTRARGACEALQAKCDELVQSQDTEATLARTLRQAIVGTRMGAPTDRTALGTLSAMATEIEDELRQRDRQFNTAAGKRDEREQNRVQLAAQEKELFVACESSIAALAPSLAALLLPAGSGLPVARARLGEFDVLVAAQEKRDAAVQTQQRASDALSRLEQQCRSVAVTLGDPAPADLRLYVERVLARLKAARAVETERTVALQAHEGALENQRTHQDTAARHALVLERLCAAAGVASTSLLPHAEEQSRRKRDAQVEIDRARTQLAQASRRSIEALRSLLAGQDGTSIDADEAECLHALSMQEEALQKARQQEEDARHALAAVDSADTAVVFREGMESALASVRSNLSPWIRSRLAHALLTEALRRFRERAQGPMLIAASSYFSGMTNGEFTRLVSDDTQSQPVLMAQRHHGAPIHVEAMSEGTRDQLYLALRLAALALRRSAGVDLPVILDDALMTSDDTRAGLMLQALADFSTTGQVIVFTHHAHLIDVARRAVSSDVLSVISL